VHGARRAAFGLHFNNRRDGSPNIGFPARRFFIGQFTHRGGGGNGVNGNNFIGSVRHRCGGGVTVNCYHLPFCFFGTHL